MPRQKTSLSANFIAVLLLTVLMFGAAPSILHSGYKEQRTKLVENHIKAEDIPDPQVIKSMLEVPRHEFVPDNLKRRAYENTPLPIGYGQTISQPYIVALMTELLEVSADDTVLEVGTGSGYQAAVLAEIVKKVYTIEIIKPLAESASKRLQRLGYKNVELKWGDGYFGWDEHAPFDAIIVTAASDHIPPPLIEQLKKGGRMCIPVGQPYYPQVLKVIQKDQKGEVVVRDVAPVMFVPLTRELEK